MEDASKALEMAFAVLVFVVALSLAMTVISQARTVADVVFYVKDKTNFAEYIDEKRVTNYRVSRIVGIETVIPTIYRHYKEGFNVVIRDENNNIVIIFNTSTNFRDPEAPDYATGGGQVDKDKLLNKGKDYGSVTSDISSVKERSIVGLIEQYLRQNSYLFNTNYEFEESFIEREIEGTKNNTTIIDITYKMQTRK